MSPQTIKVALPWFPDVPSILQDIGQVLESGQLMNGPFAKAFEQEVCERWNVAEAISLTSCTTALQIALSYLGVKGKKILVSTNTFVSQGYAVLYAGGVPVFCDLAPGRLCPGSRQYEERLTTDTVGVIFTHIAGIVDPGYEEVVDFCERKGLFLIEDCAQAHGEKVGDSFVGTRSQAGCFSFYPTKILTTGTGGMLTTNDSRLAAYARSVRLFGRSDQPYLYDKQGNDWFMSEVAAVIGLHQLRQLERFIEQRRQIAALYKELLRPYKQISFLPEGSGRSVYYKLPVIIDSADSLSMLSRFFEENCSLETEPLYYPPCHMQPVFLENPDLVITPCEVAEDVLSRQFCLPLHAQLSEEDVQTVVQALKEFFDLYY